MKALAGILLIAQAHILCAADPFFKPNDVVALVGGEDMAVMRDYPALELLVLQQPGLSGVKFRNLAQEGDTVFEQFRDLNFPSWEEQLKKVGATVVIAQFGKMEALAGGENGVAAFIAAYEKLLDRFAGAGRRVAMISPLPFGHPKSAANAAAVVQARNAMLQPYVVAESELASRRRWGFVNLVREQDNPLLLAGTYYSECYPYEWISKLAAEALRLDSGVAHRGVSPLLPLLQQKNTLWFHYWRPQNWAFLAGDRTEQPSSRDHRDPAKRWFPAEMDGWLPLVAAKEKEIQTMIEASRKP